MLALLANVEGVVCRACGATHATPDDNHTFGVCGVCWDRFGRSTKERTEDAFNRWLARELFLELRRLRLYGVSGRCEAVSNWLYRDGAQCAHHATMMRDTRRVCGTHGKPAVDVAFVGGVQADPYEVMFETLIDLAHVDERLMDCLQRAAKTATEYQVTP